MTYYIDEYLNPNSDLDYSYDEIKQWVINLNNEGKSITEIKDYLMEKLDIYDNYDEQLICEKIINCMINNKKYRNRVTGQMHQ